MSKKYYWVYITTGALVEAENEEEAMDVFDMTVNLDGCDWDYNVEEA